MFRGTTPTLYFKINNIEDLSTIQEINIIFKNDKHHCCKKEDGQKLIKTLEDVEIDEENKIITLTLTQQETLLFKVPSVLVQIKFMFDDEKVCASSICEIPVEDTLDTHIMRVKNDDDEDDEIVTPGDEDTDPTPETPTEPEETEEENPSESEDAG